MNGSKYVNICNFPDTFLTSFSSVMVVCLTQDQECGEGRIDFLFLLVKLQFE